MRLNTKTIMILSEMLDKMEIKNEIKNIEGKTNEEVGKELLVLIATKLYKVEDLIYKLIIEYKEITVDADLQFADKTVQEENKIDKAKNIDFMEIVKELINIEGVKDFLASKQD